MSNMAQDRRANETHNYAVNFPLKSYAILGAFAKKISKKSSVISATFSVCT
jgi:hypothetical protein